MSTPWRAEWRTQLRLAAPLAAVHAGQQLMSAVDTAIVGRLGAVEMAAVGLGTAVFGFFYLVGLGLMMGLDPLISQAMGAARMDRATALLWQGVYLSAGAALLATAGTVGFPLLMEPLGIDHAMATQASDYLWWRAPSLWPGLLFVALRSWLQAVGRTRPLVVSMVIANIANFFLASLLVHGEEGLAWMGVRIVGFPALGVRGAALATVIATLLQLVVVAGGARVLAEGRATRTPVRADLLAALRVGLPIALHLGAEVGVFSLAGVLAARLGTLDAAAHQVAIQLASLSFTVAVGIGSAGSVRVGWAVGALDGAATRRNGSVAFALGAAWMGSMGLLLGTMPGAFAALITTDPDVRAASMHLLGVAAVFQLSDGVQAVGAGVLRGAGDTRFLSLANIAGHYAVGLPVALALGFGAHMGVTGLWWGLCAGLSAVAVALVLRFERLSRGTIRPLDHAPP